MSSPRLREKHWWLASWAIPLWLVGLLCFTSASGCRGCLRSSERLSREELEKRAKEEKEAIEAKPLLALPADAEVKTIAAKPGHWIETVRSVKSNREDLQIIATGDVLRGRDMVLNIPGTSVTAEFARATVLPKGQAKTIDLQYYVPTTAVAVDPLNPVSTALHLRSSLLSRSLLTPLLQEPFSVYEMKHPEFLLVVVSPKPLDYAFLSATDLVLWRGGDLMLEERPRSYHVILCASENGKLPFPTSMLTLTSTAAIVWDDLAPDDLSEDQKIALVDWLHWGGQLIISGPSSWSRLQNSFLMPYLPIRSGMATELATDDLAPLNHWIAEEVTGKASEPLEIVGSKVPGLAMELTPEAQWLPESGELVAERYVGRGRVVVTGFPIREQRLYRWKYYQSFLSTGLLRRPARTAIKNQGMFTQVWERFANMERDPRLNTQVRIASRDMPLSHRSSQVATEFAARSEEEIRNRATLNDREITAGERRAVDIPMFPDSANEAVQWSPNGAAWSDTSGFAFSAMSALRSAAGIVLPDRWTIMYLIGGYLAVLVPLNWLVFRLIGRLELAWVAAPIIALLGVVVVTKVARLDIGFARRTTEIGLLELHGDYGRGHLTNYAALYTSLSTNYAIDFPDRGSVALPLGDISRRQLRAGNTSPRIQARYGTSAGMRLEPVTVYSNSTEMLHSEQMVGLKGGILYAVEEGAPTSAVVKNTTGIALKSCCLVGRTSGGEFQYAWIGDLVDDTSRKGQWTHSEMDAPWQHWNKSSITRRATAGEATAESDNPTDADASGLLVGGLLSELVSAVPLVPGQVRLLGYTDDRPGKMVVEPADDQLDSRTVVMAHLRPANWLPVTPDKAIIGRTPGAPEPSEFDFDAPPDAQ